MIEPKQQGIVTVTDQPEAINEAPEDAPEALTKNGYPYDSAERVRRIYGKRNPDAVIEQRQQRLSSRLGVLSLSRQLVLEHAERESVAVSTAWKDWDAVQKWVAEDFERERPRLVSRIAQMRERLFSAAVRKGQLQTAAMLLKDMGAVVGEVSTEAQAAAAPTLNITVEDKRQG
jgi:heme-degrading monooxygenase HmoA